MGSNPSLVASREGMRRLMRGRQLQSPVPQEQAGDQHRPLNNKAR